jgi:hypothetical protein
MSAPPAWDVRQVWPCLMSARRSLNDHRWNREGGQPNAISGPPMLKLNGGKVVRFERMAIG